MNNIHESSGFVNGAVPSTHRSIDGPDSALLSADESAEAALRQKADELLAIPEVWTEIIRQTVRSHPLLALAAAVGLGALIVRVAR